MDSDTRPRTNGDRGNQTLILLSVLIGIIVGLTVVAFILLTGRLAARMYPPESAAWRRIFVPTAGALLSGWLLFRYFPQARGSGIPQAKYALFLQKGVMSLRTVIGKFVCCSISLASGVALGREGPSVQIGAGIASVIGQRLGLSTENLKALIPIGSSAALATAFNTPIAAVLFSLEEILGNMHAAGMGAIVVSSATAWMVLHLLLGDQPLFHVPAYKLVHPVEFAIYAVLGLAGGLGSVAFVKLLLTLRIWFRRLPKRTVWAQPVVGGLVVGLLGWFSPQVLGVGYDYVDQVLGGDFPIRTVAVLAVLKIVATPMCYSSGNAGGIFGPSLFIGAMIGGAVGGVAHTLLPGLTATPGAYALVGMGAAFAGIVRTPITSVIMIFEMTRDYSIIVPLMISNLVSFFVSRTLQPEPIYEALALQEGVYLPSAESRDELAGPSAEEVMRTGVPLLALDATLDEARQFITRQECNSWPAGETDCVAGIVTRRQIGGETGAAATDDGQITVRDVLAAGADYPFVHPDHPLNYVLEKMRDSGVDSLPVVSRADIRRVVGVVTLESALETLGIPATRISGAPL